MIILTKVFSCFESFLENIFKFRKILLKSQKNFVLPYKSVEEKLHANISEPLKNILKKDVSQCHRRNMAFEIIETCLQYIKQIFNSENRFSLIS